MAKSSLLQPTAFLKLLAEWCAAIIETLGLGIITLLALHSLVRGAIQLAQSGDAPTTYRDTRQRLARGILLGLELLVAADIIRTVALDPTLEGVGVLTLIVAIRTFLSFTLELDLTGRWPWQGERGS